MATISRKNAPFGLRGSNSPLLEVIPYIWGGSQGLAVVQHRRTRELSEQLMGLPVENAVPWLDDGVADRLRQLSPSMAMISDLDDSIDQCDRRCRVGENSRPV